MSETQELLVPNEDYLKSGIHIGTKFKTKYMEPFIYKIRPDGLSVLNVQRIDERLRIAAKFLSYYAPEDILVVVRRENGWYPAKKMGELTGIRVITGRYLPGIMTNPQLKSFIEPKVVLVGDPIPDKNAVNDALRSGIPVVALSHTNNSPNNVDLVVPCNNKGKKSLAMVFFLLTREYMINRGLIKSAKDFKYSFEDFYSE